MTLLSADNPKARWHREDYSDGWSSWSCIPVKDVVESGARDALIAYLAARGVTVSPDLAAAAQAVVDDVWPWESDQSYGVSKAAILNLRRALPASPDAKSTANDARVSREASPEDGLRLERYSAALREIADWNAHSDDCSVIDPLSGRPTGDVCSCGWVEIADVARTALDPDGTALLEARAALPASPKGSPNDAKVGGSALPASPAPKEPTDD